jgi:uncharacterized protein (DUF885 family)
MRFFRKFLGVILAFVMVFSLTSCNSIIDKFFGDSAEADNNERQFFDELTSEIFLESVTSDTLTLHYTLSYPENYGITEHPISIGSYAEDSTQSDYEDLNFWFSQLKAINYDSLTSDQQLTYDILYSYFSTELISEDYYLYFEPLSTVYGDHLNLPILFAEYIFNTEQDIDDYLALLV